jgi:hypothetical protein
MLRVALFCRARFFFRIPIALWQKWIVPAEFAGGDSFHKEMFLDWTGETET